MERRLQKSVNYTQNKTNKFNIILLGLYLLIPVLLMISLSSVGVVYATDNITEYEGDVQVELIKPIFFVDVNDYPFGLNPIEVNSGESTQYILTESCMVSEVLAEVGIEYDNDDIVIPKPEDVIAPGANITVIKIFNERLEELVALPFETVYQNDPDLPYGDEEVVQIGLNGQRLDVYTQKYEDGEFVSKTLVSEQISYNPVTEIISKGTRREIPHSNLQTSTCDTWDAVIDGVTGDEGERRWMKSIMRCESGCNAGRVSYNGTYHGLFQFLPSTFAAYGGTDIYDGNQQIPIVLAWVRVGVQFTQFPGCTRGTTL